MFFLSSIEIEKRSNYTWILYLSLAKAKSHWRIICCLLFFKENRPPWDTEQHLPVIHLATICWCSVKENPKPGHDVTWYDLKPISLSPQQSCTHIILDLTSTEQGYRSTMGRFFQVCKGLSIYGNVSWNFV